MDKLDEIQAKIRKQEDGLWDLEDSYRDEKKKIEDSYWELEDNHRQLTMMYEEFGEVAYHFGRQDSGDDESRREFVDLLDVYSIETDFEYRRQREKIEDKAIELDVRYRKERRMLEDQLEEDYRMRRKLYDEEDQNKW